VRLLGPIDVITDGGPRPVHGSRRKAVLATLALHHGEIVSTDRLVDVVWGTTAPSTAVNTLQSHVSHLRGVLGCKTAIVARPPGYVLDLGEDDTDVRLAERLLQRGTRAGDPAEGAAHLRAALALWRGQPLADTGGSVWLEEQAERLDLLCLQIRRALTGARLASGEHGQLMPELEQLVADNPLDEQIRAQLMLALYRSGRQADALAAYQTLRRTLDDDLGIDPSQALRDLETAILRQDPALDAPTPPVAMPALAVPSNGHASNGHAVNGHAVNGHASNGSAIAGAGGTAPAFIVPPAGVPAAGGAASTAAAGGPAGSVPATVPPPLAPAAMPVPAQLPPAVPAFAGRCTELASLDAILPGADAPEPATVVISALSGTAGVGKTTLAVHWAHRVSSRFPDGQLYVNLRGFDPSCPALDPGEALRGFLDALGVPLTRIPDGLAAQVGLYRSLLAGKRVLVLLDNARDVEQVRPLLPGSPGCLAIVTSRNQLTGLVAEGASPLSLDLLTFSGARDLLSRRLGADRVAREPDAVADIIEHCARLPLALTIAAARAAMNPSFPLAVFATELREALSENIRALDAFDVGDVTTDARAVFSWSYRALSTDAARLFRLLGLHTGPEITVEAAASLAGVTQQRARGLLAELSRSHLLAEHNPSRYGFHDLLRAYAAEQAHTHDSQDARDGAVARVLDHYLHTAYLASALLRPALNPITLDPPRPGVVLGTPATAAEALDWFAARHLTLMAAVQQSAEPGPGSQTWQLAWTMTTFLLRLGLWQDQATVWNAALAAACRDGDTAGEATALHGLASGYARAGRLREAEPLFAGSLELFESIGDHASQATIHNSLTVLAERELRPADMLSHSQRALELYRAADHKAGQAWVLNNIGYSYALLGRYQQGLSYCQRALLGIRVLGEKCWEAATWHSLGYIHHHLGDYPQALTCYERSLGLCGELGDLYNEADTLDHIGNVYCSAGDARAAHRAWTQALRIFDEIDHPSGRQVRSKLRSRYEVLPVGTLGPLGHPFDRIATGQAPVPASAC
jgi:DNA-binding SARP family transcriptional activator/Tfp pilus assembly protein PilF